MTLTTRVSAFFLATLAVGLGLYSLVSYSVARRHLDYQFEHEMRGVLNSLVAAAEVEETEVKWQPLEHSIALGANSQLGEMLWAVIGDEDLVVEKSRNGDAAFTAQSLEFAASLPAGKIAGERFDSQIHREYLYQRLVAPNPNFVDHELDEFDQVLVVVGRSTSRRDETLAWLFWLVAMLPLLAWVIIAACGRWIVRQALRPVSAMSQQAQSISGSDFQARLHVDGAADELADLGNAFNRVLARQQIAYEQQRRFTADAAHELRTPLTVLLGEIDVTLRRPRTPGEYTSNLEILRQQTTTLQEIVESLLFLARTESEGSLPQLKPLRLKNALNDYWVERPSVPRQSDLGLDNALADKEIMMAVPSLLARVWDNLISNALKYSPPGAPVTVQAFCRDGQAIISVSDEGPGISPQDREAIFEPFYRTRDAREGGMAGTGLGLTISRRIASALGGRLTCESEPGKGSCFSLYLPLQTRGEVSKNA